MEGEMRTFRQLKREKNPEELNRFAKEVTEAYATSVIEYSQTNAAADNNLTKKCLREVMDYAIINSIVSKETSMQVLYKAMKNQQRKAQDAGGTSIRHHQSLIEEREELLLYTYTRTGISKIARDIAENPSQPIHHFTKEYNLESDRLTKKILERSIVENIVSDEVMEKLIERSLSGITEERVRDKVNQYFEDLRNKREENKKKNSQ